MIQGLIIIASILIVFIGIAVYNYHQTDKSKAISAGAAWSIATFWPVILPLALIVWIADKGEKIFDDISKNGLKNENKQGKSN